MDITTRPPRWGNTAPLRPGGWAALALEAAGGDVGELRALTLNLPAGTGDHIPDSRLLDVLKAHLRADFPLTLGAWVLDWGPVVGWHAHGLALAADAERLAALPGRHELDVRPVYDLPGWVRYMTKAGKKGAEGVAYSARMARLLAALPGRRRVNTETGELLELSRLKLPSRVVAFTPAPSPDPAPTSLVRNNARPLSHNSPPPPSILPPSLNPLPGAGERSETAEAGGPGGAPASAPTRADAPAITSGTDVPVPLIKFAPCPSSRATPPPVARPLPCGHM